MAATPNKVGSLVSLDSSQGGKNEDRFKLPRITGITNEIGSTNNYYKKDKIRMARNFRRELEKATDGTPEPDLADNFDEEV